MELNNQEIGEVERNCTCAPISQAVYYALPQCALSFPHGFSARIHCGVDIIPKNHEEEIETYCRKEVIDLSTPRQMKSYDKWGNSLLISQVKQQLFGSSSYVMTEKRCEAFFEDDTNFVLQIHIIGRKIKREEARQPWPPEIEEGVDVIVSSL